MPPHAPPDPTQTTDKEGLVIARVQPLTRTRAVRGLFDYRLGPEQRGVGIGSVLRIPFGGRNAMGVVVEVAARSELEPERLAEPEMVLEERLPPELVELAAWMASEYCSTLARTLALMLPPGSSQGVRARHRLTAKLTDAGSVALANGVTLTDGQREALERLRDAGPQVAAEIGTPALRRL